MLLMLIQRWASLCSWAPGVARNQTLEEVFGSAFRKLKHDMAVCQGHPWCTWHEQILYLWLWPVPTVTPGDWQNSNFRGFTLRLVASKLSPRRARHLRTVRRIGSKTWQSEATSIFTIKSCWFTAFNRIDFSVHQKKGSVIRTSLKGRFWDLTLVAEVYWTNLGFPWSCCIRCNTIRQTYINSDMLSRFLVVLATAHEIYTEVINSWISHDTCLLLIINPYY